MRGMKKLFVYIIGISAFLFLLSACATNPSAYQSPELYTVNKSRIEKSLAEDKVIRALQDYFLLKEIEPSGEKWDETATRNKIRLSLREKFQSAIDETDYTAALKYYRSIAQIDWTDLLDGIEMPDGAKPDIESLQRSRVMSLLEVGRSMQALAYVRQQKELSFLNDEDLQLILETAIEEKKQPVLQRILKELEDRGLSAGTEIPEDLDSQFSQPELIRGTVTIWVNRGMRIEQGVGLPDRVIGSGFYIDKRGYIITNYHVISSEVDPSYEGFSRLYIRPSRNPETKIPARVVGWDPVFDIALLKVETESETVLSISPVENHKPGEKIFAIGSPGGLENTITSGIISAVNRRFLQMGNVIQVDVPINQGNSGGPLIDASGNIIGVVFAGIEQFEGVNFAIPVQWLIHILPKLYDAGAIQHPFLGAALQKVDEGLEVLYCLPESPAARIGLETGDLLQKIGGISFEEIVDVQDTLLQYSPGTLVKVEWTDDEGNEEDGYASLAERPELPLEQAVEMDQLDKLFPPVFGMQVQKIQDNLLGTKYVVEKVYRGSVADETGMSVNDPFSIQKWQYLDEQEVLLVQIRIKKRKAGFLETGVQMGAYIATNNFI